jgi:hypothetical protein
VSINYRGPGIYRHYKGGYYRAIGVGRPETDGPLVVVYHSYSVEHDLDRWMQGVDFVTRPLESVPGVDAWNDLVADPNSEGAGAMVPRFEQVAR